MHKSLRLGVLLHGECIPEWQRGLLQKIRHAECYRLEAVVLLKDVEDAFDPVHGPRLGATRLYRLTARLDRLLFPTDPDIFGFVEAGSILEGVPRHALAVRVDATGAVSHDEDEIAELRALDLDVLIHLGQTPLGPEVLQIPAMGVWALHHGDFSSQRGTPPGFWEVVEGRPETGITLRMLSPRADEWRVLGASWSATHPFSPNRNRNEYYWRGGALLARTLESLCREGERRFFHRLGRQFPRVDFYAYPPYAYPTNAQTLKAMASLARRLVANAWLRLTTRHNWFLLYTFKDRPGGSLESFREIQAPRGHFWADPFALERNGRHYIFFEDLVHSTGKGHISVMEVDEHKGHSTPKVVLERPYHLSYPFLLEWDGRLFMVPESSANKTVELYECEDFPDRWVLRRTLLEGVGTVDSTIHFHEDRWWLFTSQAEPGTDLYNDELHIYWSDDLLTGEWHPHPRNPVVSDVRAARPAGAICRWGSRLYRPAQDCSGLYGRRLKFHEITVLTETEYEERLVTTVDPAWRRGVLGVHTFNRAGRLTVMDAFSRRPRFL